MTTFFGHRTLVDLGPEWLERWGVAWEPGFLRGDFVVDFRNENLGGSCTNNQIGVNTVETYMNKYSGYIVCSEARNT